MIHVQRPIPVVQHEPNAESVLFYGKGFPWRICGNNDSTNNCLGYFYVQDRVWRPDHVVITFAKREKKFGFQLHCHPLADRS